jgi:hypothetical protein
MNATKLIRLGGLAAIVAGVLRTAGSFWPSSQPGVSLELLYLVIDLFILFGILGMYGFQCEQSGRWGFVGFLLAISGTAFITGPDGQLGGINVYDAGALVLGIGLCFLAIGSWRAKKLPRWIPALWVFSTAIGIAGASVESLGSLFVVSGVAFGAAFVGGGATVWSQAASTAAGFKSVDERYAR